MYEMGGQFLIYYLFRNLKVMEYTYDCHFKRLKSLTHVKIPDNVTNIICNDNELTDLQNLIQFVSLHTINFSHNMIDSFLGLPRNITRICCNNNEIESLKELCNLPNLISISCSGNQITSLVGLPDGVKHIRCSYNRITSFLGIPACIKTIECNDNRITSFDNLCGSNLKILYCNRNNISSFKGLEKYTDLTIIECNMNYISSFDYCPKNIKELSCCDNKITDLYALRHCTQLKRLLCSNNEIVHYRGLENCLKLEYINCRHNRFTNFIGLPDCVRDITCDYNRITELIHLPSNIQTLSFKANPICKYYNNNDYRILRDIEAFIAVVKKFYKGLDLLRTLRLHYIIYNLWMSYWHYRLDTDGCSRFIKYRALKDYKKHFT